MKEFMDQEETRAKDGKDKPDNRFDRSNKEIDDTQEEDFSLGIIHMIGGLNHHSLKNRIRGEICMIRQINEVLSVQSTTKKLRQTMSKLGGVTFTKADLDYSAPSC